MRLSHYTIRGLVKSVLAGASLTAAAALSLLYWITGDVRAFGVGLLMAAALFGWGALLLKCFAERLTAFTSSLCGTLDSMMNGRDPAPMAQMDFEKETLLARIGHRLERLYGMLQESRRKAEADRASLQSLVSDISHQTKTPIASLKMLNETLLTRQVSEENRQEFLQSAVEQLDKLDFLIQAMVKTSRLETGVITLEKKRTPILETLSAALNGVLVPLEKKGISLSVDCPEDFLICHDSRWTSEALFNLLDNAVKYTAIGGSIHVSVKLWEMHLKIDITDTGMGIPESTQAAVFKRFYRGDQVHEVDGIGIGLYLAREIITMQGGYIKVSSAVGQGSTFTVFLPRQ